VVRVDGGSRQAVGRGRAAQCRALWTVNLAELNPLRRPKGWIFGKSAQNLARSPLGFFTAPTPTAGIQLRR